MTTADRKAQAELVVKLRDQGMSWKELSLKAKLSANGKPMPKLAKQLYDSVKGSGASRTLTTSSSKGSGVHRTNRSGGPTRARGASGGAAVALPLAKADPMFLEYSDEELRAMLEGRKLTVVYTVFGAGSASTREHMVAKVKAFGRSPRSGIRYVEFLDTDQKYRTIALNTIVKVG